MNIPIKTHVGNKPSNRGSYMGASVRDGGPLKLKGIEMDILCGWMIVKKHFMEDEWMSYARGTNEQHMWWVWQKLIESSYFEGNLCFWWSRCKNNSLGGANVNRDILSDRCVNPSKNNIYFGW